MLSKIEDNIKEKDNDTVETEKIIIEIPKNTNFLSLVCFFTDKDGLNVNNQILGIKPIKERKEYIDKLETEIKEVTEQRNCLATKLSDKEDEKQELLEKLEEIRNDLKNDGYTVYADDVQKVIKILKREKE